MSEENVSCILEQYDNFVATGMDLMSLLENINCYTDPHLAPLSEAEYNKVTEHLKLDILDVDKFIKINECKEITNPIFYSRDNIPTDDGLLSNKIFGITQEDRAGIFGYIDLNGWYLDPSCYKCWTRVDSNIKGVIHKTAKYKVTEKGEIVEDPNGSNGVEFLKKNINKIKFKKSDSIKRDMRIKYLEKNRNNMFINKYIVIPPYYRDANTGNKRVGIGGVNKLYQQLIISINALKGPQEYGFDMSGPMQGRVQELLLALYDWFCGTTNNTIQMEEGSGLSGKLGIYRRANMSKTSTYSCRLIITCPELKVRRSEDMMVSFKKSAIPLAACIACFKPFIQFNVKRFFENEFIGTEQYPVLTSSGKVVYEIPKDPLIVFSDDRIKDEMEKFIHGYNNRFVPIEVPLENPNRKVYMQFRGRFDHNETDSESIYHRKLTWTDVFYMAAVEAVKDKNVLISRYPIDSKFNEITTEVEVSSTNQTEPMYVNNTYYRFYPKIREEDINTNTGNKFIDTLKLSNLYLAGLGGDYDGDQVTCKGVFTREANEELRTFQHSKANFIDVGAENIRMNAADAIQSLYALTKILKEDESKLVDPVF